MKDFFIDSARPNRFPVGDTNVKMNLIRYYAACLACTIDYMRSFHVAHRDIRPENILFDKHGTPKLVDFSHCVKFPFVDYNLNETLTKAHSIIGVAGNHSQPIILLIFRISLCI
jgi:serine/threonine protein kinase